MVTQYLMSVLHSQMPVERMGRRTAREMRTISECLDCLLRGELPELGDMLMQRLKALERSVTDGNWTMAQEMELIPPDNSTLSSPAEVRSALQQARRNDRLKARSASRSPGGKRKDP